MSKKAVKSLVRDEAVLKLIHKLRDKLPTGTTRIEVDVEFVDGYRIKLEKRGK